MTNFMIGPLEVIYIGKSDDVVRGRLLRHEGGKEGSCTLEATNYCIDINDRAREREIELLNAYEKEGLCGHCH